MSDINVFSVLAVSQKAMPISIKKYCQDYITKAMHELLEELHSLFTKIPFSCAHPENFTATIPYQIFDMINLLEKEQQTSKTTATL